jgi:hypothetical protein
MRKKRKLAERGIGENKKEKKNQMEYNIKV